MIRKLLPFAMVLLAPLAVAACSSGEAPQTTMTTTSNEDQQARSTAQDALKTAQAAQVTANDAKAEADRMNQKSLQK